MFYPLTSGIRGTILKTMNLAQQRAHTEAFHGIELLADYAAWINKDGIQAVADASRMHVTQVERYKRAFKALEDSRVQAAARMAQLSFTTVQDLGAASYVIRKRKDKVHLLVKLCQMLAGLSVDQAIRLIKEMMRQWVGDTTKRPDTACMHKRVGRDGKRRFTAALSPPIAARIDTILHRLATKIKDANPELQYDHAYAEAFIRQITSGGTGTNQRELFGPMFMINTDCRFHSDGTMATTDGAIVNIRDVVNERLARTGWAAVTGTTDDDPVIPLVGALVKVHNRVASAPQRMAAILETLVCAWPGCSIAASKCQIHHIKAYARGGLTTGVNLTALCKTHNGENDDNPSHHVHGRIERDPITGRPGLRRTPGGELEFNHHQATEKTITAYHQQKP